MIVSYDVDGVLAEQPPPSEKAWGKMNGAARAARKAFLKEWYTNAIPLISPKEETFYAISARKNEPDIRNITLTWLNSFHPNKILDLFLLDESRSIENVVLFKAQTVVNLGVERHYEDNKKVLKGMGEILPPEIELFFWKKGMQDPEKFDVESKNKKYLTPSNSLSNWL